MRILELLTEGREAPLYHFSPENRFFKILASDTLVAGRGNRIYFTRDYARQFVPADITAGSWGLRINQDLLRQRYGKRLQAGGQSGGSEKTRQAWLADPKNADIINKVKSGEFRGSMTINGFDVRDAVKGTIGKSARWESEEHLMVDQLPNLHEYITGIVYAGGKSVDPHRTRIGNKQVKMGVRSASPEDSLDELATLLMGHFKGEAGFAQRDNLIDYMTKFNIPLIYQRQEFPAKAVKQHMIEKWRERKAERARKEKEDQTHWIFIRNPQGGGVSGMGPSNPWKAATAAMKAMPEKFPNGMFGLQKAGDEKPTWFLNIYTSDKLPYPPNIAMVPVDNPPTTSDSPLSTKV